MSNTSKSKALSQTLMERRIFVIRDQKVMLDSDLAELYGVTVSALNQAVTRNSDRFPEDFMFQLSTDEWTNLRSQSVISSLAHGGRRFAPRAFTQEGVAMLSSVLRSQRAIDANIQIMRTFVRMREAMISHKDLARRIGDMESKYDYKFKIVFDALRGLTDPPPVKKKKIGYIHHDGKP